MNRSKWIAAAVLFALAVPTARAGDRTRIQIQVAPYWGAPYWAAPYWATPYRSAPHRGWYGPDYRSGPRTYRHRYYDGHYRDPVIRFEYDYGRRDYRSGGDLRYDSRRHRDYYRNPRNRNRHERGWHERDWRD